MSRQFTWGELAEQSEAEAEEAEAIAAADHAYRYKEHINQAEAAIAHFEGLAQADLAASVAHGARDYAARLERSSQNFQSYVHHA